MHAVMEDLKMMLGDVGSEREPSEAVKFAALTEQSLPHVAAVVLRSFGGALEDTDWILNQLKPLSVQDVCAQTYLTHLIRVFSQTFVFVSPKVESDEEEEEEAKDASAEQSIGRIRAQYQDAMFDR
jgi:hypothetical protein